MTSAVQSALACVLGGGEETASLLGWPDWLENNRKLVPRTDRFGRRYDWLDGPFDFWKGTASLDVGPASVYEIKPPGHDRGPVPTQPLWRQNRFIFPRAAAPIIGQAVSYWLFPGVRWHPLLAWTYYFASFGLYAFTVIRYLHHYMDLWGCLDEEHRPRQLVSDDKAGRVGASLWVYALGRITMFILLAYDADEVPWLTLWTFPRICLWLICLDYYFYAVHRTYHQCEWAWKHHALHHRIRAPTPVLAILSDDVQEAAEIWILPLLAFWTVPLNFHELYLVGAYQTFVEGAGHAGIRAHWAHPLLGHILSPFGMDLTIEDHDLHHRYGRSGRNYGKQTMVWDRIFGTVDERVEVKAHTVHGEARANS